MSASQVWDVTTVPRSSPLKVRPAEMSCGAKSYITGTSRTAGKESSCTEKLVDRERAQRGMEDYLSIGRISYPSSLRLRELRSLTAFWYSVRFSSPEVFGFLLFGDSSVEVVAADRFPRFLLEYRTNTASQFRASRSVKKTGLRTIFPPLPFSCFAKHRSAERGRESENGDSDSVSVIVPQWKRSGG